MGSSSSKAARTLAGSAARKYPQRAPGMAPPSTTTSAPTETSTITSEPPLTTASVPGGQPPGSVESTPGPTVHSNAQASEHRTEAIDLDARDPQFDGRLSQLGPVKPYPTFSPSSTSSPESQPHTSADSSTGTPQHIYPEPSANPAIMTLTARAQIQEAVEQEKIDAGRPGFAGRQYVDVGTLRKALALRDERGMRAEDIEQRLKLKRGFVKGLGRVGVVEAA